MKNKPRILIIGPYPPVRGGISEFNYNTYKYLKEISTVFVLSIKKSYPSLLFPGKSQFYKSKNNLENFENFNIYNPIEFPFYLLLLTDSIKNQLKKLELFTMFCLTKDFL